MWRVNPPRVRRGVTAAKDAKTGIERLTLYEFDMTSSHLPDSSVDVRLSVASDRLLRRMRRQHPKELTDRKYRILRDRLTARDQIGYVLEGPEGDVLGYCHTSTASTLNERINYLVRLGNRDVYLYDDHIFAAYRRRGLHRLSILERCRQASADGFQTATTIISDTNTASIRSYQAFGLHPRRLLLYVRRLERTYGLPTWTPGLAAPHLPTG